MSSILPNRLDWPSAIGNFILNYGVLDWNLLVFLESRLPVEQFNRVKEKHFQDRITRIRTLVETGEYTSDQKQGFSDFFNRLEPIRELRNHIAHGHPLVRLMEDRKTLKLTLSLPRDLDANYAPGTRHLEFAELSSALTELTALIEAFQNLAGDWNSETLPAPTPRSTVPSPSA